VIDLNFNPARIVPPTLTDGTWSIIAPTAQFTVGATTETVDVTSQGALYSSAACEMNFGVCYMGSDAVLHTPSNQAMVASAGVMFPMSVPAQFTNLAPDTYTFGLCVEPSGCGGVLSTWGEGQTTGRHFN